MSCVASDVAAPVSRYGQLRAKKDQAAHLHRHTATNLQR